MKQVAQGSTMPSASIFLHESASIFLHEEDRMFAATSKTRIARRHVDIRR